jgi:hypothetical protein
MRRLTRDIRRPLRPRGDRAGPGRGASLRRMGSGHGPDRAEFPVLRGSAAATYAGDRRPLVSTSQAANWTIRRVTRSIPRYDRRRVSGTRLARRQCATSRDRAHRGRPRTGDDHWCDGTGPTAQASVKHPSPTRGHWPASAARGPAGAPSSRPSPYSARSPCWPGAARRRRAATCRPRAAARSCGPSPRPGPRPAATPGHSA